MFEIKVSAALSAVLTVETEAATVVVGVTLWVGKRFCERPHLRSNFLAVFRSGDGPVHAVSRIDLLSDSLFGVCFFSGHGLLPFGRGAIRLDSGCSSMLAIIKALRSRMVSNSEQFVAMCATGRSASACVWVPIYTNAPFFDSPSALRWNEIGDCREVMALSVKRRRQESLKRLRNAACFLAERMGVGANRLAAYSLHKVSIKMDFKRLFLTIIGMPTWGFPSAVTSCSPGFRKRENRM